MPGLAEYESEAEIGHGCYIEVELDPSGSPGVYTEIKELKTISQFPSKTVDDVDVTHMKSPNKVRELRPGGVTLGPLQFGINWIMNDPTHDGTTGLRKLQSLASKLNWRVQVPQFGKTFTIPNGYVKEFNGTVEIFDAIQATVSVQPGAEMTES
jgi:hypothetical protein